MNFDLHCHSTVSDGRLTPAEVVRRAAANGVTALALTDHDEVGGLAEARAAADELGMRFVDGVEVSVTWDDTTVHVVGLGIDPSHPELAAGLERIRSSRGVRAEKIAAQLDALGIHGSLEGAYAHAGNSALIGRTHFARFLVERGYARDVKSVFQRYLAQGKPGYVPHHWSELEDAVRWIRAAGGVAVIAHPGRYKLARAGMRRLLDAFRAAGGAGIEVATSSHTEDQYYEFSRLALEHGLAASRGSDFHAPGEGIAELGRIAALPRDLTPIWDLIPH